MITELHVRNFKSVKAADLKCSRINVFIGEPNTGKSNILETIALLNLFDDRYIINFATTEFQFVFRISQWRQLFHLEDLSHPLSVEAVTDSESRIRVQLHYNMTSKWVDVMYGYGNEWLLSLNPANLDYIIPSFSPRDTIRFGFYRFRTRNDFPSKEIRFVVPPDAPNLLEIINTKRRELIAALKRLFSKYRLNLVLELSSGSIQIQQQLTFGEEEIPVVVTLPYSALSDSLHRMVFNLAIVLCNEKMTIALEEPETHTFPLYVKYLAEKIARDDRGNQYFISTHNPYFLISLLEKAPKKDVNVFITSLENYETKVRMLTDEQKEEILDMGSDVFFNLDKIWEELGLEVEK
jgi:AAA15 family ATPase/GTPase